MKTDPAPPRYNVAPTQQVLAVASRPARGQDGRFVRADRLSLQRMLVPAPADRFVTTRVSTAVNAAANDGPGLLEPAVLVEELALQLGEDSS